jgi:hypothetical protein
MSKVLNYTCSSSLIDDYIIYKLCGPIKATYFPTMASILQLTTSIPKYTNYWNTWLFFVHPKEPTPHNLKGKCFIACLKS